MLLTERSRVPPLLPLTKRSLLQGLFSRITFREPLFLGGAGNTTGLAGKLPVERGLRGCVRHLEVNDQLYDFSEDAMQGFDVGESVQTLASRRATSAAGGGTRPAGRWGGSWVGASVGVAEPSTSRLSLSCPSTVHSDWGQGLGEKQGGTLLRRLVQSKRSVLHVWLNPES